MRLPKHPWTSPAARALIAAAQLSVAAAFAGWAVTSCGSSDEGFKCGNVYGVLCGKACTGDADCDVGLSCGGGSCGASCTPATGCTDGKVCSLGGSCVDPTPGISGTPCGTGAKACPSGFYCSGSSCQPGCGTDHPCPEGTVCGSNSTCGPPGALTGVGATGAGGSGFYEGDGCVNRTVGYEGRTPTVLLLVDQSGSMNDKYPPNAQTTRWTVLHDALMNMTTGAVKQMEATVRMGLALYSSNGGSAGGTCPQLTQVPIAINNYNAIEAVYGPAVPDHDTPTGPSIAGAVQILMNEPDPRYILLITDGLPDTCEDPNPGNRQPAANQVTVQAAQAAFTAGIRTIMMGVSADISGAHLQEMANAGAGLPPNTMGAMAAKYYVAADNQAALAMQLAGILGGVRSCVVQLGGVVDLSRAAEGIVTLDNMPLVLNDPNGFRLNSASELEVLGAACEKVKGNSMALRISFPCDAVDIAR